jgi:predicted  nucleic acid-binding Zn-ribbon protein
MAVRLNLKMVVGMKKSKTESERDLLAKNHRRLNKAIDDLLNENKALRKRLEASTVAINEMRERIANKSAEDRVALIHTVVHALSGQKDMSSKQIAERAFNIAGAIMERVWANDNGH